eukprot:TRINITY_DN17474_c0_g1_i1.p1 TRINITY_DN17474_c0_g1~~TRINITY_DN17474_c0_g1_i1.p1  ORF type:complete len:434 (+),score=102.83 TRINITY_DN17474_c0_g1_i1:92-1393(+)
MHRMCLVQGGLEVQRRKDKFQTWMKECEAQVGALIRGQEDSILVQKKLAAAEAQLSLHQGEQSAKAKKVMERFVAGSAKGMVASSFKNWKELYRREKQERDIAAEYEDRIEKATASIQEYHLKRLELVRKTFSKKGEAELAALLPEMFDLWSRTVKEIKEEADAAKKVAELEAQLAANKSDCARKCMEAMRKMAGANDEEAVISAFESWKDATLEFRYEKEMQRLEQDAEDRLQAAMQAKSAVMRKVMLVALGKQSPEETKSQAFSDWKQMTLDAKEEARLQQEVESKSALLSAFGAERKASGQNLAEKAMYVVDVYATMRAFYAWRSDYEMTSKMKVYAAKIEAKRQQLVGVHQMFRSFATQLETGLKSEYSEKAKKKPQHRSKHDAIEQPKRLSRTEGSLSLPDIHKPSTPSGIQRPRAPIDSAVPKAAWT